MEVVSRENLTEQENRLKKFLEGERTSNILCMTVGVARLLKKRYPEVNISKRERINKRLGLYIYLIRKSSS